jgi:hypothetical protein
MKAASFVGTFDGVNYARAAAYRTARQPQHSFAHSVVSGTVMACFVFVAIVWLGSL